MKGQSQSDRDLTVRTEIDQSDERLQKQEMDSPLGPSEDTQASTCFGLVTFETIGNKLYCSETLRL